MKDLKEEREPETSWRVRVSAGQIPLGRVLDLIKQARQP